MLGNKGNPTQNSDGNTDSMKDESIVEPIDDGKLKTAIDIDKNDTIGKNMNVHTKKGIVLHFNTH